MPRPRKFRPALKKSDIDRARGDRITKKDKFLWDGKEHGLGVKITPAGSKVFILQKTIRGRLRRIKLGTYGDMTLDAARIEAQKLNGVIAANRDPVAEAKAEREEAERRERSEKAMQDLWDRYALEVVAVENKPTTAKEKRRMWKNRVGPALGKLKVKDVTTVDAGEVVRAPLRLDAATGQIVAGKGEAGNLYRFLHHMFRKALAWGLRPRELGNPLEEVIEPKVPRRERLLTSGEIGALWKALNAADTAKAEPPQVLAIIRAVMMGGPRISELLTLKDDHIRDEELELHLPDTKSGFSARPISAETLAVLRSVERMPGVPYIFRSVDEPTEPLTYNTVEKAFRRIVAAAGVQNCTLHTVRHWFATMTANSVNNPRVGMKLTGHKSLAAYMNYVHAEKEQAHALAAQLSTLTTRLSEAAPTVTALPRRAKGKRA